MTTTMTSREPHYQSVRQRDLFAPQARLQPPTWQHSDSRAGAYLWQAFYRESKALWLRYAVYRGNKVAYLRHLGVRIGEGCDILNTVKDFGTEPWLIELGNRVTVAHGVIFLTHDGASRLFRQQLPAMSPWGNRFGTIRVGDNVFIGVNAVLMPEITIGSNSIIGVGSVVNKDVPPNTVVAGVPARPLCSLDEYIARYHQKMIPLTATTKTALRAELTETLWGERR